MNTRSSVYFYDEQGQKYELRLLDPAEPDSAEGDAPGPVKTATEVIAAVSEAGRIREEHRNVLSEALTAGQQKQPPKKKDKWDLLDILAKVVTSIGTLIIGAAGFAISNAKGHMETEKNTAELNLAKQQAAIQQSQARLSFSKSMSELVSLLKDPDSVKRHLGKDLIRYAIEEDSMLAARFIYLLNESENKLTLNPTDTSSVVFDVVATTQRVSGNAPVYWVYLGQKEKGILADNHWQIEALPPRGATIMATDAVYKRSALPTRQANGDWKLGNILGAVRGNEAVTVLEVIELADQNYWAKVQ